MKIAVLCGGPSLERGISLNSARSVLDHVRSDDVEIIPIYFDQKRRAFQISPAQLYSNTPSDFDFKLAETGKPLSERALIALLKKVTLVFPAMHGAFGEDGTIQAFLAKHNIPHVGSPEIAGKRVFDKHKANEYIAEHGFFTLPSLALKIYGRDHKKLVQAFFKKHAITRAIVKPATGGSSIGVFSVATVEEALERAQYIFSKRMDTRVVIEPFATGTEFTVILLENRFGQGVAIMPTEIEADYSEHQVFDFRKKYLPTRQVAYHCPPRFSNEIIEKIQIQAEQLWSVLGMRDFARFDGWVLPDGNIWFSDFNPISGMEQNSFLFQQAARIGFSHRDVLRYVINNACRRHGFPLLQPEPIVADRKPVAVLCGGGTAERQVSLMSGTNVWLKLRRSKRYKPTIYVLDTKHSVWKIPYALVLNHTVEEVIANAERAEQHITRLRELTDRVQHKLALQAGDTSESFFIPERYDLETFAKRNPFVFIALHGGIGEDGTLQKLFTTHAVRYNGSNAEVSALCMDKWKTNETIKAFEIAGVNVPEHLVVKYATFSHTTDYEKQWNTYTERIGSPTLIVKPRGDGCSTGIVQLTSARDLATYVEYIHTKAPYIPKGVFPQQFEQVEMPQHGVEELLLEAYVVTDVIRMRSNTLKHVRKSGWIEVTVGVLERRGSSLRALAPSITVAEGSVLSVEEKFQGGTGVNITPPPRSLIKPKVLARTQELITEVATRIGIRGYARIDAFLELRTGNISVIEINTLPGLTPSTVLYHQGLAESKPLYPLELLETIINATGF